MGTYFEDFPYVVRINSTNYYDHIVNIYKWLDENFGWCLNQNPCGDCRWWKSVTVRNEFRFRNEEDAIMFKLKWG
jgi:hypothetical protein